MFDDFQRSKSHIVDISMFQEWSAPSRMYYVDVDSSMTRLIIEITVDGSPPVASLERPSGRLLSYICIWFFYNLFLNIEKYLLIDDNI